MTGTRFGSDSYITLENMILYQAIAYGDTFCHLLSVLHWARFCSLCSCVTESDPNQIRYSLASSPLSSSSESTSAMRLVNGTLVGHNHNSSAVEITDLHLANLLPVYFVYLSVRFSLLFGFFILRRFIFSADMKGREKWYMARYGAVVKLLKEKNRKEKWDETGEI